MKSGFSKKLFVISTILTIQGFFLYAFYVNEGLIFNFKIQYLTKIYLPSYILSLNNFKLKTNNYLANVSATFNLNDAYIKNDPTARNQYAKSIPVLLYHGVIEKSDGDNMLIDNFRDQMFALKKAGWQTVTLEDFYKFTKGEKELPDKSFLLTFDDGRKDSYYPVDPILKALDYNAVMFVITKYSLGDNNSNYYLSKTELKQMLKSGRWEIEAHTREGHNTYKISPDGKEGHFYSNKLWLDDKSRLETDEEFANRIKSDFVAAKNDTEQELNSKVISFAFPFGDYGQNSLNFPEAEDVVTEVAGSIYSMTFYQVWPGRGFSFNYPNNDESLIKRIDVKPDWTPEALIALLDAGKEKSLPYSSDFEKYAGWIKTWGNLTLEENLLILGANESSNGSFVFLDGSRLWKNYVFEADVYFKKGQTYSIIAGYKDSSNYIFCSFTPSGVRLEQMVNGERKTLNEFKGKFNLSNKEKNIGIGFSGTDAACYLNNKRVIDTSDVDEKLDNGGIGFKIWDPQMNNSEMSIKNISVEAR